MKESNLQSLKYYINASFFVVIFYLDTSTEATKIQNRSPPFT